MKMKRTFCLALALLLIFSVCGCKKKTGDDSEYSVWYEDEIISGGKSSKSDKTDSSKSSTGSGKSNTGSKGSGASDKNEQIAESTKLDFGGKTITLLREWGPYARGKYSSWDNWLNNLEAVEKECNVKIVEKKWSATLAGEMLAGVKPEGNIYLVSSGEVYSLATKGYIAGLNSAMKKSGIDMTGELFNKFNTGLNNINGEQYTVGLGFARVPAVILYNKKVTKDAGYDIAKLVKDGKWTWDMMTEIAKKTTVRSASGDVSRYGIAFGTTAPAAMAVSNNSHVLYPNSSGKFELQLSSAGTKEALQQLYDWANVDKVAEYNWGQKSWTALDEDFASKKVAMLFAGHNGISVAYNKLTDEYGVAYLPKGPRASGYVSYLMDEYSYVIPAAYSDMAADLLVLLSKLHRLPKGYTVDDEFRDEWIRYFKDADAYKMFKTLHDGSVKQVWDGTNKMAPNAGATTYASAFGRLFQGELTPGAFIDTYQSAFKASVNDSAKKVTYTGPLK